MGHALSWVTGPWPGRLALAARPRGGEWLDDEIAAWQRNGIEAVYSLLTPEEERDLDLTLEAADVRAHGMGFRSLPIPDREVPPSRREFVSTVEELDSDLSAGRDVLLHCRQGIGRTGLLAACVLVLRGETPETAMRRLSDARGVEVPETADQRRWIERYAEEFAVSR